MSAVIDYKRKIYAIRDLPTLPVIAQKVLAVDDDDLDGPKKLAAIISADQSLSARALSLANSAYYGYRAKVATIRHAVNLIGMNMLKQLSLSVLVCGTVGRGGKRRIEFWRHSFGTAIASSLIAKHARIEETDVCFMAGLLHDIGRVIIDTHFPEEQDLEHTDVGAYMAERWQLPPALIDSISHHHSLDPNHLAQPIIACVHLADVCAKHALQDDGATEQPDTPDPAVLKALRFTAADFQKVVEELRNRTAEINEFLT
jgi:putative nucleotidyltransferase with HDIG domain